MCGIIGVFGKYRYKEIPEALRERGRDDEGIYEDDYVQLIQTRLQITGGKVKLPYEWGQYVLLFNGEIYNRNLWYDAFDCSNEYELILKMYHYYKSDFTKHIEGQYYIIIYDKQDHSFIVAQDIYKIQHAYRMNYNGSHIISSNLRSLPKLEYNKPQDRGYGNITTVL